MYLNMGTTISLAVVHDKAQVLLMSCFVWIMKNGFLQMTDSLDAITAKAGLAPVQVDEIYSN